jgi:hypothetical protein
MGNGGSILPRIELMCECVEGFRVVAEVGDIKDRFSVR